jgi:RIO kinase 1
MAKISKEKFKVKHNVFDEFTNQGLFKLISQGHFDGLESPISIGKEANIFSAKKGESKVMVKIYRLESCDFNKMYDYIKYDPRYIGLRGKKRKIIFAWVQREFRNLIKAREAGVNVPLPLHFLNNILVMEFIGDREAAPKLKDSDLKNPRKLFNEIINNIRLMYKAGFVHADLSAFNILDNDGIPVFIDFSQCTGLKDPRSNEYLERDVNNIISFFKKKGVDADKGKMIKKIIK